VRFEPRWNAGEASRTAWTLQRAVERAKGWSEGDQRAKPIPGLSGNDSFESLAGGGNGSGNLFSAVRVLRKAASNCEGGSQTPQLSIARWKRPKAPCHSGGLGVVCDGIRP